MRGLPVLTIALVFASATFLSTAVSAQGTASLDGLVCVLPPGYAQAAPDSGACAYGMGLPEALVTLSRNGTLPSPAPSPVGPTQASDTTDANGQFRIPSLSAGEYSVKVTRSGFKDLVGKVTVDGAIAKDFALEGLSVEAKGKVTDADGAAVPDATVALCCDEQGSRSASTGSDGRYTVAVTAGFWSVDVRAPGFQPASQHMLVDGSDIDLRVERMPPQDAKVSGVVLDQDGAPVPEARVALYNYGGCCIAYAEGSSRDMAYSRPYYSGENYTFTDEQGRYSIGAYAGDNGLTVTKEGHAHHSRTVTVEPGQSASADVELLRYPEKTARVVGTVVDAATGDPVPHLYLGLESPEYGLHECSERPGDGGGSPGVPRPMSEPAVVDKGMPAPESPGCAIRIQEDGSFEGLVTPGYGILSVHVDSYASCQYDERGVPSGCGPEYYGVVVSRMLAEDDTTTFDIRLRARPAPDAEVSGYVVDAETGQAVQGAQVSFSNQDTHGYGTAVTDADGSYRIRLRSGHHMVTVWAPEHLRWQGNLDVPDGDTPFDVLVQPGTEAYGGCCYYGGVSYAHAADKAAGAPQSASSGTDDGDERSTANGGESSEQEYLDLGGGLGPYDPAERQRELQDASKGSPGPGLLLLLAALGAILALRRRE